jgi:hypothetical protein
MVIPGAERSVARAGRQGGETCCISASVMQIISARTRFNGRILVHKS